MPTMTNISTTQLKQKSKIISAIAVFIPNENIKQKSKQKIRGYVKFSEEQNSINIKIELNLTGFKPYSSHGFHVHEAGDLTDNCTTMCAHFNPYNKEHGCPGKISRHVGDLGNITADENGDVKYIFYDNVIKLRGSKANIIGRGLIIHEDEDDCGNGNNEDSLITGNSGARIACAIIGYSKDNFV